MVFAESGQVMARRSIGAMCLTTTISVDAPASSEKQSRRGHGITQRA
jgi:hypothetical protein